MGRLTRALRIMHPVQAVKRDVKRAVIPKPIRKAKSQALSITHPVEHLEYKAVGAIDKAITPKKSKKKVKATGGSATRRSASNGSTSQVLHGPERDAAIDDAFAWFRNHLTGEVLAHGVNDLPQTSTADQLAKVAYDTAFSIARAAFARRGISDQGDQASASVAQATANSIRAGFVATLTRSQEVKSEDGQWWWDGERWHPVVRPPGSS